MYDIHTHILYGMDDGAKDFDTMLLMARTAVLNNVSALIATPHHANERYWNPADLVRQRVNEANEALQDVEISLTIYPGHEVRLYQDLTRDIQDQNVITLNDSRYLLLELPSSHVPSYAVDTVYELQLLGITPVIAHPERNAGIARNILELQKLIEAGALAQVTTHSLTGHFGRSVRRLAMELCRRHLVHLIASDAHNPHSRNCNMKQALDMVVNSLGQNYHDYYITNARAVLDDLPIEVMPVESPSKKRFLSFRRFT